MYKGVRHLLKKIRSTEISVGKKDWNVVDKQNVYCINKTLNLSYKVY